MARNRRQDAWSRPIRLIEAGPLTASDGGGAGHCPHVPGGTPVSHMRGCGHDCPGRRSACLTPRRSVMLGEEETKRKVREALERKRAKQADANAARGGNDAGNVHGAHLNSLR